MPVPSEERVTELVSDLVQRRGFDLEDVVVTSAGKHSAVRVVVDSDAGLELDQAAELSREISAVFDDVSDFGESPYNLEVTSPGVDRPLTLPRHWRRSRGRKATFDLGHENIDGRIGRLNENTLDVVVGGAKTGPAVREIPLDDIRSAVVRVEFSKPNPKEMELAGGVAEGRVAPAEPTMSVDEEESEGQDK
ncbi:ribosome maturation factor RimP [Rhodococcus sp. NPDC058521]|uniref:ribosome maturation factor RimP n=1 Tax=Rhodococcus sp. NPDC058521 TaxID=3346536 RepID=UPI00365DDB64